MLLLVALLAGSGGEILEARLEAGALGGSAGFEVSLEYRIAAPPEGGAIAFHALQPGGVAIDRISARSGTLPLGVELHRSEGPRVGGTIELPERAEEELALSLQYRVSGPTLAIPLLVLDLSPGPARPGLFTATVVGLEALAAGGGFPTNAARAEDGTHRFELPLVPAFVSLGEISKASSGFSSLRQAGFSFWGLFAVFAAVIVLYLVWMKKVEA